MPGPFPGMDPYLEHPAYWRGVHHRLITYIADTLSARLPKRYITDIDERLYVVEAEQALYPDVLVKRPPKPRTAKGAAVAMPATGSTALVASDPAVRVSLEPQTLSQGFIEIRLADKPGRAVTVIELLSPTNKAAGTKGRKQYRAKQKELLRSSIHLLEIDLLRGGEHTVAAPREPLRQRAEWDYLCSLHRAGADECETWPVTLQQRLPRVAVPLAKGDADFVLDLQAMLDHCYDAGRYADQIDYRREPDVPLPAQEAAWAHSLLREKKLRKNGR
ncbi:MAG: DUF4058 family protein [Planctomycetia bacterium]|nr:DUF4058 family protein [Planctomycetia bacterium]